MRYSLRYTAFAVLFSILGLQSGCGGGSSSTTSPTSGYTITVTPPSANVVVGNSRQFTAQARDSAGNVLTGINFAWRSSDTTIAVTGGGGIFRGLKVGTVSITAGATVLSQGGTGVTSITSAPATLAVVAAVEGVAARGAALSGASVTLRDARGQYAATSTDANGHFLVPVDGLTGPFLLKVDSPDGQTYFGTAATVGTANLDPYTDLAVREWYALKGGSPEAAFAGGAPLPSPADMHTLDRALGTALKDALLAKGVDADHFSVLATLFTADHTGFDQVLDESRVDVAAGRVDLPGLSLTLRTDRTDGSLRVDILRAGTTAEAHYSLSR